MRCRRNNPASVDYGTVPYVASGCVVTVASIEARCQTVNGVGTNHNFRLTVGGQTSVASTDTKSYTRTIVDSSLRLTD